MRNHVLCSMILIILGLSVGGAREAVHAESAPAAAPSRDATGELSGNPYRQGPTAEDSPPAAQPADAPGAERDEEGEDEDEREVDVEGRVFVRNTITRQGWANRLSLASARLKGEYRDHPRGLRIEVDIELAEGEAEVRDAHVRWRAHRHLRVQAGRFKRPISAISLTSRWDLPVIERGYLNDLRLVTAFAEVELPLGGRSTGVAVTVRDRDLPARPELVAGVFRSAVHEQLGAQPPLSWSEQFPEDVFARVEVEPMPWLELAASLAWVGQLDTAGERDSFRHGFVANLDAVVEWGPFRGWFEGFTGTSPLHLSGGTDAIGRFQAVRAIASGRWPVTELLYLEPYASVQFLDSSDELEEDRIVQAGGGINLGIGEAWRVQTGWDHASVDPLLLYDSSTLFIIQLGAVF